MIAPNFFWIGLLTYLFIGEFREWIDMLINYEPDNKEEPIPESVKHMYS